MRSRSLFVTALAAVALMVPAAILSCGSDDETSSDGVDAAVDASLPDVARPTNDAAPPKDAANDATLDAGADADADAGPTAKLVVHSFAASVIVGDGSRLRQAPVNGVAIFEDATLIDAGPLDVTEIQNLPGPRPMTNVATYAGVTISEVWMPSSYAHRNTGRTIRGTVEGVTDGGLAAQVPGDAGYTTQIFYAGGQLDGVVTDAGSFRLDVIEPITTPYDVAVVAMDNQSGLPFRAGFVPVALNPDGGSTAIDVPMDHRVDESLTFTALPPGFVHALSTVWYSAPGADHVDFIGQPVFGNTIPMFDRAPPFDTADRWACLGTGSATLVRKIPAGASSIAVTAPAYPTMSAPAISIAAPYPEMATDSAVFTWTAKDPQASLVKVRLSQVRATSSFDWNVYASASAGTYRMFSLPADLATLPFALKDESAAIQLESVSMEKIHDVQDVYASPRGIFYLPQELSEMFGESGSVLIK
jgi:hypothetical protein